MSLGRFMGSAPRSVPIAVAGSAPEAPAEPRVRCWALLALQLPLKLLMGQTLPPVLGNLHLPDDWLMYCAWVSAAVRAVQGQLHAGQAACTCPPRLARRGLHLPALPTAGEHPSGTVGQGGKTCKGALSPDNRTTRRTRAPPTSCCMVTRHARQHSSRGTGALLGPGIPLGSQCLSRSPVLSAGASMGWWGAGQQSLCS